MLTALRHAQPFPLSSGAEMPPRLPIYDQALDLLPFVSSPFWREYGTYAERDNCAASRPPLERRHNGASRQTLATFDFKGPAPTLAPVPAFEALAQRRLAGRRRNLIAIGNSGTGKRTSCAANRVTLWGRSGHRVFYTADQRPGASRPSGCKARSVLEAALAKTR